MTRRALAFVPALLCACAGVSLVPAHAQQAQEILAATDRIRNPGRPFRATSTLVEYLSGKPRDQTVLAVYVKDDSATGEFRNIVRYIDPPRDKGKLVLGNGNIMWFYDPSSRASVRVSPLQRLIGQASVGDVIAISLAQNYKASLVAEETIQDADRKDRACWHLDMNAANGEVTYYRIEYWIEKQTHYPIKGKFYSDSGRLLKIAYYRKFERQLGGMRPTEAIIIDAVDGARVTKMSLSDYRFQDIPELWFQREYLARIPSE